MSALQITVGDDDDEPRTATIRRKSDTWLLGIVFGTDETGYSIGVYWPQNTGIDRRHFDDKQAAIDAIVAYQEVPQ